VSRLQSTQTTTLHLPQSTAFQIQSLFFYNQQNTHHIKPSISLISPQIFSSGSFTPAATIHRYTKENQMSKTHANILKEALLKEHKRTHRAFWQLFYHQFSDLLLQNYSHNHHICSIAFHVPYHFLPHAQTNNTYTPT